MRKVSSKHVQGVLVTDPDTGGICEVEIRKLEGGSLVGLDGAFLNQTDDNAFSPYDKDVAIMIPDDEDAIDQNAVHLPHHVVINYGDGENVGVYHYPDKELARQHVNELLAERLGNIHVEDDDGVRFSIKIDRALEKDNVDAALALFHQIPDNLESISYFQTIVLAETPLNTNK